MNEANELKEHNDLAFSLSKLEFFKEQRYDQFCQLILASKTSDLYSVFYEGANRLLHRQLPYHNISSYHIGSKEAYVPWLTTTSLQDTWGYTNAYHPTVDQLLATDGV